MLSTKVKVAKATCRFAVQVLSETAIGEVENLIQCDTTTLACAALYSSACSCFLVLTCAHRMSD